MKVELLVVAFLAAVSSAGIVTKESTPTCGPDEFECPKGCCPEAYFTHCCTQGPYEGYCSGVDAIDCPTTSIKLPNLLLPKKSDEVKKKTTDCEPGCRSCGFTPCCCSPCYCHQSDSPYAPYPQCRC